MRTRTGVLSRMGWLPFYRSCHLPTAIDSIETLDPLLLQCTCLITQPSGAVKRCRLRFTHTETFELSLSRVRACDGSDSHNRCACCLEWVFRDGVRCHCCHHRLHRRCAAAWLVRSKSCPTCRTPWIREPRHGNPISVRWDAPRPADQARRSPNGGKNECV